MQPPPPGMGPSKEPQSVFTLPRLAPGFKAALPMAVGVASYGLVFGVLSQQAGMTKLQSLFMSAFVFAGASQFVALDMWSTSLPVFTIILTCFVVNMRHILMGAVLKEKLAGLSPFQTYGSLFFLVDENWAFTMAQWQKGNQDKALLAGTGICLFLSWTLSTALGAVAGSSGIDPVKWGIDFAFTAIFIFLATGMWRDHRDLLPWIVAGVTAVAVSHFFPGKWYILAGSFTGSVTGVTIHGR